MVYSCLTTGGNVEAERRAIFLDIDDTIYSKVLGGPFEDDLSGIARARGLGHRFFLCSGRSAANIPPGLKKAAFYDGIVAGGGAHVVLGGKTLYQKWLETSLLSQITEMFLASGKKITFRGDREVYAANRSDKVPIRNGDDFIRKYPDAHICMITVDKTINPEQKAFLESYFDMYPQPPHYDCFIKGECKSKGMQVILDALGLDRKYSVAIGDSSNDVDGITYAGTGIAVGNACEELKVLASWVSAPCGEGAVVRALEYLGLC
jgi:hydroxymethylpyrimidine pyrophosphatase-like HAD family hydrolase